MVIDTNWWKVMNEPVFIDSDVLVRFLAINQEKKQLFDSTGTTGVQDLDNALSLVKDIEANKQVIIFSEVSILEILCYLKRFNSDKKIPAVLTNIYKIGPVQPVDSLITKFAWFFGSKYNLHSGDSFHIAFSLFYDIQQIYICDSKFYNSFIAIQQDIQKFGSKPLEEFFQQIPFSKKTPEIILKKLDNMKIIKCIKVGGRKD